MASQWRPGSWPAECGGKPQGGGAPAGIVQLTQSGRELQFSGAGRAYSTSKCWEQAPGLTRVSHSAGARSWRNTCRTPPSQAKRITVITTISASDNRISFDETGQYQFRVGDKVCTGSTRKTRSFQRLVPVEAAKNGPQEKGLTGARVASGAAKTGFDFGLPDTTGPARPMGTKRGSLTPEGSRGEQDDNEGQRGAESDVAQAPTSTPTPTHRGEDFSAFLPSGTSRLAVHSAGSSRAGRALSAAVGYGPDGGTQRKMWFIGISSALALSLAGLGLFQWSRPGSRRTESDSDSGRPVSDDELLEPKDTAVSGGVAPAVADGPTKSSGDPMPEAPPGSEESQHNQLTPVERGQAGGRKESQSDGAAVGAGVPCPACGEIYTKGEKFCGNDGSSLVGSATPTD